MAARTSLKLRALIVAVIMIVAVKPSRAIKDLNCLCCQHAIGACLRPAGATARPSDDLINPPAVETTSTGRHLTQSPAGPASAGCADAGVSCCYSPTWWIEQQVSPSAKCTDGTFDSSITPEILLQACEDGTIGEFYTCYGESCGNYPYAGVICTYYENLGDYTGPFPCTSNDFDGETITVYDSDWLIGGNDEVVWEDASVASNEPSGVSACDNAPAASYTFTATYSKSSSWNIGIQLGAKIQGLYSAALTIGFSQTFTSGANGAVTVDVATNQHGTITRGTLVHHTIGWWNVEVDISGGYEGCTTYRIDNVASDLIMPTSNPYFPTDYSSEVKPCGYPLLNGHLT
ncbi:TPA: hypothetical protein ACH3X2_009222 [Trebouxia sp. C0005]